MRRAVAQRCLLADQRAQPGCLGVAAAGRGSRAAWARSRGSRTRSPGPAARCGRRRRGTGAAGAPSPRPTGGRRRRRRPASRPSRPGCGGPGPRRAPGPAGHPAGRRSARCRWRPPRCRWPSASSYRTSLRSSSSGWSWLASSTMTLSRPNALAQLLEFPAGRVRARRGERGADGALAAAGEDHPVPVVRLGEVAEVVDGAALLAPGELRGADRPAQPPVPLRVAGQHQQVLAGRVGDTALAGGQAAGSARRRRPCRASRRSARPAWRPPGRTGAPRTCRRGR